MPVLPSYRNHMRATLAFNGLTKFLSNNEEVFNTLPTFKVSKSKEEFLFNIDINEGALGVNWNIKKDVFQLNNI